MYKIIDVKTSLQVGTNYKDRRKAINRADKLDLQYGAIRYKVIRIEE